MIVKAKQGTVCPRADGLAPIDDREAQVVPDAAYYRRRVADGSLVRAAAAVNPVAGGDDKPKAGKGKS
jgi:hypothetical protein